MSESVRYKGKLQRITVKGKTIEQQCEDILKNNIGGEPPKWLDHYDGYTEYVTCELQSEYVIYDGDIFKVIERESREDFSWFEVKQSSVDIFEFDVAYYNGVCCFAEAIEQAFENRKQEESK